MSRPTSIRHYRNTLPTKPRWSFRRMIRISMPMSWMRLGWMLGLAAAVLGCGSGSTPPSTTAKGGLPRLIERPRVVNELRQIYLSHQTYALQHSRPPRNLEELNVHMEPNSREYQ